MRLVKQLGAVVAVGLLGRLALGAVEGSWALTLLMGVVMAVLLLLAYAWVVRRTERRDPVEVGRAGAGGALGRGVLIGTLMFVVVIGSVALLGGYRIEGAGSATLAVGFLGLTAIAVVTEEVLFRGVLFRILEERTGTWFALVVTGLAFGAMHLLNPEATVWGAIAIAIEAGGMLGAAYAATRTLWLPIGLHLGWNFAVGGLFGTEVSGNDTPTGLLDGVTSGSTLLSGGAFGPEASLAAVLVGLVMTVVFLRLARRRGHLRPSPWRAAPAAHAVPAPTL